MFFSRCFFLQSSISGILINILIGGRFILAMSGLALSSHSALIPHLLTWPTTTKRPSPALLLPDLLLNRAVEKYSYLTTSMATSYLLLLTKRPAHLINLLNSSNLYIIYTLQQSDSASVSYVYLDVSPSLIDFKSVFVVTVVLPDEIVHLLLGFVWSEHKQTSPRHSEQKLAKKGKPGLFGFSTPS